MTSIRHSFKTAFRLMAITSVVALLGADSASACHKQRHGSRCGGQTLVSYVPPTPVGQYGGGCYGGGQAMTGGYSSYPMTTQQGVVGQGSYGMPATGGMVYGGEAAPMMGGRMGQVIGAPGRMLGGMGRGITGGYNQGAVANFDATPTQYGGNVMPGQYGGVYSPGTFDANVSPTQYGGNVYPGQYGGNVYPGQYGGNVYPGQGGGYVYPGQGGGLRLPGLRMSR